MNQAPPRGPRIGRPDRLARLEESRDAPSVRALNRMLASPAPTLSSGERRNLRDAAALVAAHLGPVPKVLEELATVIRRHCGHELDESLAKQIDQLRDRIWPLLQAVARLAEAGAGRRDAEKGGT